LAKLHVVLEVPLGAGNANNSGDGAEGAGNTVQEVYTTSIVQVQLTLAPVIEFQVTEGRDNTANAASQHGHAWHGDKISSGAHHDTTSQG